LVAGSAVFTASRSGVVGGEEGDQPVDGRRLPHAAEGDGRAGDLFPVGAPERRQQRLGRGLPDFGERAGREPLDGAVAVAKGADEGSDRPRRTDFAQRHRDALPHGRVFVLQRLNKRFHRGLVADRPEALRRLALRRHLPALKLRQRFLLGEGRGRRGGEHERRPEHQPSFHP
jgi:hypothetical protein